MAAQSCIFSTDAMLVVDKRGKSKTMDFPDLKTKQAINYSGTNWRVVHTNRDPDLFAIKQIGIRGYPALTLFAVHTYVPMAQSLQCNSVLLPSSCKILTILELWHSLMISQVQQGQLVWCFEPGQPLWITSGLNTNFRLFSPQVIIPQVFFSNDNSNSNPQFGTQTRKQTNKKKKTTTKTTKKQQHMPWSQYIFRGTQNGNLHQAGWPIFFWLLLLFKPRQLSTENKMPHFSFRVSSKNCDACQSYCNEIRKVTTSSSPWQEQKPDFMIKSLLPSPSPFSGWRMIQQFFQFQPSQLKTNKQTNPKAFHLVYPVVLEKTKRARRLSFKARSSFSLDFHSSCNFATWRV